MTNEENHRKGRSIPARTILLLLCLCLLLPQGTWAESASGAGDTKAVRQTAVSGLTLENDFGGTVLSWKETGGADGYMVYRKAEGENSWSRKETLAGAGYLYWVDKSARKNGSRYSYIVFAYRDLPKNTATKSANSDAKSAVTDGRDKSIFWLEPVSVTKSKKSGTGLSVAWTSQPAAGGYQIQYSSNSLFKGRKTVKVSDGSTASKKITGLSSKKKYYSRVRAFKKENGGTGYSEWSECSAAKADHSAKYKWFKKKGKPVDYKKAAGQKLFGYDTFQGGTSDGKYTYILMNSRTKNKCRLAKIRLSDGKKIKVSKVLDIGHGNGIAYNGDQKVLAAVNNKTSKPRVTLISPSSLKIKKTITVKPTGAVAEASLEKLKKISYLTAAAYCGERKQYVFSIKGSKNFLVTDSSFNPVRYITAERSTGYLYQGLECTGDYIVRVQSPYAKGQVYNTLAVFDWNGDYRSTIRISKGWEMEHAYFAGNSMYAGVYHSYNVRKYYWTYTWKKVKKGKKKTKWKKVRVKKYYLALRRDNYICRVTEF